MRCDAMQFNVIQFNSIQFCFVLLAYCVNAMRADRNFNLILFLLSVMMFGERY
jgi:hypothetical protein